MKKILLLAMMLGLLAIFTFSFDLSFYNSFKTLCMGETFTGIANDENALYYNPAGLTNGNGLVFSSPSMDIDATYGIGSAAFKALTHINEIKTVLSSGNNLEIADYFLKNYSKDLSGNNTLIFKNSAYFGYEGGNFAAVISGIGQGYANSFVSNDVVPFMSLHAKAAAYLQASVAGAFNISAVNLSVGGTYRYGYVMPNIYSIDNLSVLMINSSTFKPNTDYETTSDGDLGVKISMKGMSFGGLWHNVLNSTIPDVRIGIGYSSKDFSVGMDFEKLLNGEYSIFRRLHFGAEYTPWSFLNLYAGISAGWFTGGMKLNLGFLSLYAGTYVLNYGYHTGYGAQRMYTVGIGL
jgi:hypothetical protein